MSDQINGNESTAILEENPTEAMDKARKVVMEKCQNEINAVLEKYKCDLRAQAFIDPEGRTGAKPFLRIKE